MKLSKSKFSILAESDNSFIILVKKPFWIFFFEWIPLTYQEAEYCDEHILEFKSLQDCEEFIDMLCTHLSIGEKRYE